MSMKAYSHTIPKATHQGKLSIGTLDLECYVLENGTRCFSQSGFTKALGMTHSGRFSGLIKKRAFYSSLSPALTNKINNPFVFYVPNSPTKAYGFNAELIVEICNEISFVSANKNFSLPDRKFIEKCKILLSAFAKVGVTALVDDATGFISDIKRNSYIDVFKRFVLESAREYAKEFPEQFFAAFYRLYGFKRPTKNHPACFAQIIRKYVYQEIAHSNGLILEMLEEKNPVVTSKYGTKYKQYKLFQFLEDQGMTQLRAHIWRVIGIADGSENISEFKDKFSRAFHSKDLLLQ